jgi:hypothetical protein
MYTYDGFKFILSTNVQMWTAPALKSFIGLPPFQEKQTHLVSNSQIFGGKNFLKINVMITVEKGSPKI